MAQPKLGFSCRKAKRRNSPLEHGPSDPPISADDIAGIDVWLVTLPRLPCPCACAARGEGLPPDVVGWAMLGQRLCQLSYGDDTGVVVF